MARSMTGFATQDGVFGDWVWTWEIRSVNARGLDLKIRLPDWLPGLDPILRKTVTGDVSRGAVTVSLRLARGQGASPALNTDALDAALASLSQLMSRAEGKGVTLSPANALDLLSFRGVSEAQALDPETMDALRAEILAAFDLVLPAFIDSRQREGAATADVLRATLEDVRAGVTEARARLPIRSARQAEALTSAMGQILSLAGQDAPDPQRIAQELAVLAVKADVAEELDRLDSHVSGAFEILNKDGPIGRQLDFLMQEFNREANTLCAKANDGELTRIGLDLKVRIDQMREQVQNLE